MANKPEHFKIPRYFTLLGHKYRIEMVPDLYISDSAYGDCDEDLRRIRIQMPGSMTKSVKDLDGKETVQLFDITDATVVETFFHELTHAILDAIGEKKLSSNEKFVNLMARSMLEIYLSSEYDEEKN